MTWWCHKLGMGVADLFDNQNRPSNPHSRTSAVSHLTRKKTRWDAFEG